MSATAIASAGEQDEARRQATLRFATGVTSAFVLCEALQWLPSFLGPLLTVALLANLPMRPPLKLLLVVVAAMTLSALFSFVLASLLRGTPAVLFGGIGLAMFLSFYAIASGRPSLPFMLLLICVATIPVIVMIAPAQAGAFPKAMVRGEIVAVFMIEAVYLPWPRPPIAASAQEARPPADSPLKLALLSSAVVMPLVLIYLLFGLSDAMPVLITTVLLVINFDVSRGRAQAMVMILGNLLGGVLGIVLHTLLLVAPSLWTLAALLFVVLLGFGQRIAAGGSMAPVAVITCNSMLIVLSLAIVSGPGSLSIWLTRLFQFALAGAFAVGVMTLIAPRSNTNLQ